MTFWSKIFLWLEGTMISIRHTEIWKCNSLEKCKLFSNKIIKFNRLDAALAEFLRSKSPVSYGECFLKRLPKVARREKLFFIEAQLLLSHRNVELTTEYKANLRKVNFLKYSISLKALQVIKARRTNYANRAINISLSRI